MSNAMEFLYCEHCKEDRLVTYGVVIISSGAKAVRARCQVCGKPPTKNDPSYAQKDRKVTELSVFSAELFEKSEPCSVCGQLGTEWHHFAPRHLFEDADRWPTAYLCRAHHREWHDKLTPKMGGKK